MQREIGSRTGWRARLMLDNDVQHVMMSRGCKSPILFNCIGCVGEADHFIGLPFDFASLSSKVKRQK